MSYAQKEEKGYLSLQAGLNTESSPLAAPEGTTSDELNMDIDITSMVRRRRHGFEHVTDPKPYDGEVLDCVYWDTAQLVVVFGVRSPETGDFDIFDLMVFNSDLTHKVDYEFHVRKTSSSVISASPLRGRLSFTFGSDPFLLQKNPDGTLSCWATHLYIRDFKLIDDGLQIGERPTTLSSAHRYNIYNAGWYEDQFLFEEVVGDPIIDFYTRIESYPSNADIVYLGHIANEHGVTIFDASELKTPLTGNSEAPRGHYIYDIRNIDRESKLTNKKDDGTVATTLVELLDEDTNVSGHGGNILYVEGTATGVPTEPVDDTPPWKKPGKGPDPIEP